MFETWLIIHSWNKFTKLTLKLNPFFLFFRSLKSAWNIFKHTFANDFNDLSRYSQRNQITLCSITQHRVRNMFYFILWGYFERDFFFIRNTKKKSALKLFQYKKNRSVSELQYSDWVYFVNFYLPFACSRKLHFVFHPQTILFFGWCIEILLKLRSFITLHSSEHSRCVDENSIETWKLCISSIWHIPLAKWRTL